MAALDPRPESINDWLYVLQPEGAADIDTLGTSDFDLLVIDYSSDGSEAGEFTASEIAELKDSGKVVIAYLSIGEAETFRFYWDASWNDEGEDDSDAPPWLGPFNPDFPDNFKVRYWNPGWQAILFGTADGPDPSYLDRILAQGFDGIYLDIIDAFTFWSVDQGEVSRETARLDMIALVRALADYARASTAGVPNFLVFPQNGEDVIVDERPRGLGLLVGRAIRALLFNVSPADPLVYGAIVVALATTALLAAIIPGRTALRIEPVEVLRN